MRNIPPALTNQNSGKKEANSGHSALIKGRFTGKKMFATTNPEQKLADFIKGASDVLDLVGCELSDDEIHKYLHEANEHKIIKGLKLIKNHLTNLGFSKIIPYLKDVVNLNLTENALTE